MNIKTIIISILMFSSAYAIAADTSLEQTYSKGSDLSVGSQVASSQILYDVAVVGGGAAGSIRAIAL